MDNFTPLKVEKKKRKINKFLIFGNLFLVVLVAAIGIFYYNQTLITTKQKAIFYTSKLKDFVQLPLEFSKISLNFKKWKIEDL